MKPTRKQLEQKVADAYPGIWTIWGWDGGYKTPRHIRAKNALLMRRARLAANRRKKWPVVT